MEIILEKSKYTTTGIKQENIEKRYDEFKEMAKKWVEDPNSFPEKMFFVFLRYIEKFKNEHIVFFDVGAAEGLYTYNIVNTLDSCTVFSFEPETERFKVMEENLLKLSSFNKKSKINLIQKIVSDGSSDEAILKHYEDPITGEGASSSSIISFDRQNMRIIDVKYESTFLDHYLDKVEKVDIVKIDVEGAELLVLNGAINFLKKFKPLIFLEVHKDKNYGGISINDIETVLKENEILYNIKLIESHWHLDYILIKIQ